MYYTVDTTAYCQQGIMANGSYTRPQSAASNSLPLGTKIKVVGRTAGPGGNRKYVIRDRIGYGTSLDLWVGSCASAIGFGRRQTTFKIGWA